MDSVSQMFGILVFINKLENRRILNVRILRATSFVASYVGESGCNKVAVLTHGTDVFFKLCRAFGLKLLTTTRIFSRLFGTFCKGHP